MQRRHLTAMMVDMVGSTRLASILDAEDYATIALHFENVVERAVAEFDGHVALVVGDGILVLFGWPESRETDAERAVRCAARIHADLAAADVPRPLQCRIGIATGIVVVGDVETVATKQKDAVFGPTPNLAARLQKEAEPGTTLVSEETRDIASRKLAFRSHGRLSLAGFEEPQTAFEWTGDNRGATAGDHRAPLCGRDDEIGALRDIWRVAAAGEDRAATILGEAGIGKTRLVQELQAYVPEARHVVLRCGPLHARSAFHPVRRQIERWCGIGMSDGANERRLKIVRRFEGILEPEQLSVLHFLLVPGFDDSASLNEADQDAKLRGILAATLRSLCKASPLLMVVEDLHWADPSTRRLVSGARELIEGLPILLVTTRRPTEAQTEDEIGPRDLRLELGPISDAHAVELAAAASEGRLPRETLDRIVARAGGVPLFVEECAASIAAAGGDDASDVPRTLQDLLLQHLDEAGELRDTLVRASVAGGSLDAPAMAVLSGADPPRAAEILRTLGAQRLLSPLARNSFNDEPERWRFRHELMRDVAYASLLRDQRSELHRRMAALLAAREEGATEPEKVALHWELGERPEHAVAWWTDAAERHLRSHANEEGLENARRGLRLVAGLSSADARKAELRLQFLVAAAERVRSGYGADTTVDAFARCFDLAHELGDRSVSVRAGRGLFTAAMVRADYVGAEGWGERLLQTAEDAHTTMVGHYMRGTALSPRGEFRESASALSAALNSAQRHAREAGDGRDEAAIVQVEAMAALVDCFLGADATARARAKAAVRRARELGRPLTVANALQWTSEIHMILDHPDYLRVAAELAAIASEIGAPYYFAVAAAHRAGVLMRSGDPAKGVAILEKAWSGMRSTGAVASGGLVNVELAKGLLKLDRFDDGLIAVADGLSCVARLGERSYEAELHRVRGELLLGSADDRELALDSFKTAAATAAAQGALHFERRALANLSRQGA